MRTKGPTKESGSEWLKGGNCSGTYVFYKVENDGILQSSFLQRGDRWKDKKEQSNGEIVILNSGAGKGFGFFAFGSSDQSSTPPKIDMCQSGFLRYQIHTSTRLEYHSGLCAVAMLLWGFSSMYHFQCFINASTGGVKCVIAYQ
jgi:hypothetical protein